MTVHSPLSRPRSFCSKSSYVMVTLVFKYNCSKAYDDMEVAQGISDLDNNRSCGKMYEMVETEGTSDSENAETSETLDLTE